MKRAVKTLALGLLLSMVRFAVPANPVRNSCTPDDEPWVQHADGDVVAQDIGALTDGTDDQTLIVRSVPSYLKSGDLLFCECLSQTGGHALPGWDHTAIYVGNNQFIEAVPDEGVWVTNLDVYATWAKNIRYAYLKTASGSQKQRAVAFAYSQLGKAYHVTNSRPKDPNPNSPSWSCSELVWAAYYNQGIDLDSNGGWFVWAQDIYDSGAVTKYPSQPPATPTRPSGPTQVHRLQAASYSTAAVDPDFDDLYYQWDWGDYVGTWTVLPRHSGETEVATHSWLTLGSRAVRIRVKDVWGNVSPWSEPLSVTVTR